MESAMENAGTAERNQFYNKIINKAIRFYASCCVGAIAVLPFCFTFFVNKNYSEAYMYIPILMIAALFNSIASLFGAIFFAFKKTKELIVPMAVAAIVNAMGNLLLINKIGLYATAGTTAISYLIIMLPRYFELKHSVDISISRKFILCESVVFALVLWSYYTGSRIIQIITLLLLIPYCVYSNWELITQVISSLFSQARRLKQK